MQLILHLNKIEDPKARQAYIEHRRSNLCLLLLLFLTSKLIHLVHLGLIVSGDVAQYATENLTQMHS